MAATSDLHFSVSVGELARQLGEGEVSALARLYDLTSCRLLRYAQTMTRNREDAEDALQAAMVRITLRPKCLAQAEYPWPYFLRVVRNEALKILRRRRPARRLSGNQVPDYHVPPPSLETEESNERIRMAIHKLPPTQAEVIVLKIWEGMTFLEISKISGESPNTAASRYRYALEKLSHLLQPVAAEVYHA